LEFISNQETLRTTNSYHPNLNTLITLPIFQPFYPLTVLAPYANLPALLACLTALALNLALQFSPVGLLSVVSAPNSRMLRKNSTMCTLVLQQDGEN